MVDFNTLLDTNMDDVSAPEVLPAGTYTVQIEGHTTGESSQKKTPFIAYTVRFQDAESDVDQEALEEFGGSAQLQKTTMPLTFWISQKDDRTKQLTLNMLKEFFSDIGLDPTGKTLSDLIPEAEGKEIRVSVAHEMTERGNTLVKIDRHLSANA